MTIILAAIGGHKTITYAQEELFRYLRRMDASLFIDCRRYAQKDDSKANILWIGLDCSLPYSELDDAVRIEVNEGGGIITGSNERSVLIAAYRFLYELGCRFLRPGEDGDKIPQRLLTRDALNVHVSEAASYRHRGVTIEGSIGYEHVKNMLEWLPKAGMNGYFIQARNPYSFFARWYQHTGDPCAQGDPLDSDDTERLCGRLLEEIQKRSLLYHAVGHGWTYESLGVTQFGTMPGGEPIPEEIKRRFALINGKREVWKGRIADTNLCYSDSAVRDGITDCIAEYCKAHPEIDYLHFWLADGTNNHCECEECRKHLPSDYYVLMLNELDRKLTQAGLDTRIVFLIYVDLLWAPETYALENPDRFVLMFAPISRTYARALTDYDPNAPVDLKPYQRNHNEMPTSVAANVLRLRQWQSMGSKDSFDFDYHLMWDHYSDPGYYLCAKILHKDMTTLDQIGLNGNLSCQPQRAAFPTGLPMYAMAKGLWDKHSRFEEISAEYFRAAFGEQGPAVEHYLSSLSNLLRGLLTADASTLDRAEKLIRDFARTWLVVFGNTSVDWRMLAYHSEYCSLLLDVLRTRASGDRKETEARCRAVRAWLFRNEPFLHTMLDCWLAANMCDKIAARMKG